MVREALVDLLRPIRFRGKGRILSLLGVPRAERAARVFGYEVTLDLREHIQRSIWLGDFERWETAQVGRLLQPGMRFVDVGANVGYFSLLAASRVGSDGDVLAFEPSVYAFDRLIATIRQNHIGHIRPFPWALGSESGEAELQFTDERNENHTPSLVQQVGARAVKVAVRTLDEVLDELGVACVDLMKVDVEGFEPNVLAGAQKSLRSGRVAAVLIELNEAWLTKVGSSPRELDASLRAFGFRDVTGRALGSRFENRLYRR